MCNLVKQVVNKVTDDVEKFCKAVSEELGLHEDFIKRNVIIRCLGDTISSMSLAINKLNPEDIADGEKLYEILRGIQIYSMYYHHIYDGVFTIYVETYTQEDYEEDLSLRDIFREIRIEEGEKMLFVFISRSVEIPSVKFVYINLAKNLRIAVLMEAIPSSSS